MFESLGERLTAALKKISGRGVLRPEDVDAGLREVRLALLEADVNFKVVKEFIERVRGRLTGAEVAPGLTAPQQVVKSVHDELVQLLGGNSEGLHYGGTPTVVMLAGLQGSGKTTTAVWRSVKRWPFTRAPVRSRRSPQARSGRRSGSASMW
jgi:signal recognition particle subunit SRP54